MNQKYKSTVYFSLFINLLNKLDLYTNLINKHI